MDQGATRRIEIVLTDERSAVRTASTDSNGASATSQHRQQQQHHHHQQSSSHIVTTAPTLEPRLPYYPQARQSISLSHASAATTLLAAHFANNSSTADQIITMSQERDRLGLLGVGDHDAEVTGSLSGLQRLSTARYNKVSGPRNLGNVKVVCEITRPKDADATVWLSLVNLFVYEISIDFEGGPFV